MLFRSERAHGEGLVEVGDGAAMVDDALFDDGDEVEYGAQGEGGQGDAKQVLAAADQGENGMQQTERIERGGHAEPDDAHFSHGRKGELESEITVYRGGAAGTGGADEGGRMVRRGASGSMRNEANSRVWGRETRSLRKRPLPNGRGSDSKSRILNETIRAPTVREGLLRCCTVVSRQKLVKSVV